MQHWWTAVGIIPLWTARAREVFTGSLEHQGPWVSDAPIGSSIRNPGNPAPPQLESLLKGHLCQLSQPRKSGPSMTSLPNSGPTIWQPLPSDSEKGLFAKMKLGSCNFHPGFHPSGPYRLSQRKVFGDRRLPGYTGQNAMGRLRCEAQQFPSELCDLIYYNHLRTDNCPLVPSLFPTKSPQFS